jgi:hypothetical protein
MLNLTVNEKRIATMSEDSIARVRALESRLMDCPQEEIATGHVIHGGMYARTIPIAAGVVITGAEIKLATLLIISGHVSVYTDDGTVELTGYNVLAASAGRKQAFVAHSDTWLTMIFSTKAQVVEQAEDEFTDEPHLLLTRRGIGKQTVVLTGE